MDARLWMREVVAWAAGRYPHFEWIQNLDCKRKQLSRLILASVNFVPEIES
jgi:hypothetical protein